MKAKEFSGFGRELTVAEKTGTRAVRELGQEALQKWGTDRENLLLLSDLFYQRMEQAVELENDEWRGTYLVLLNETLEFAGKHLSPEDYHYFCRKNNYSFF